MNLAGNRWAIARLTFGVLLLWFSAVAPARAEDCTSSQCHAELTATAVVHSPVREAGCAACHLPTGADHPVAGESGFQLVAPMGELCVSCHAVAALEERYLHGPAAVGACVECHDPHGGAASPALIRAGNELCFRCHREFEVALKASRTVHLPAQEGCVSCHDPHGAAAPAQTRQAVPSVCYECHPEVKETSDRARVRHAAMGRGGRCANCHNTHFSDADALLVEAQQQVCLSAACHGRDDNRRSKPLRNMATELEGDKQLHGPVGEGRCSACHAPHGSDHYRLLTGAYPETFYAPYRKDTYAFCLQCHEANLLRFADTTIYTRFRNGKQNLHHTHVADRRKGRSCRACHEAHAGELDQLITTQGASFGDWNIPIFYTKTDTGGACTPGCHRTLAYDREAPVTYFVEDQP